MNVYDDNAERSLYIRSKLVNISGKKILISNIKKTLQEKDITLPVNCDGYGRIRHFRMNEHDNWIKDPLPNLPVAKALKISQEKVLKAQVFQIAGCNWNCWYCFVDEALRCGDESKSNWFTTDELIEMLLIESHVPKIIDLSGGQPDLVPEWTLWMMKSLEKFDLDDKIYLWSDDNLSTHFYWKFLSKRQRNFISLYKNYGKVCCFKGYDKKSFSFNTSASPDLYFEQFKIAKKTLLENLDLYAYVTLTSQPNDQYVPLIKKFIDDLHKIHDNFPLRTVPLKIVDYKPVEKRLDHLKRMALDYQHKVIKIWNDELGDRYSKNELNLPICDVSLK